jgi:hypothetical protein
MTDQTTLKGTSLPFLAGDEAQALPFFPWFTGGLDIDRDFSSPSPGLTVAQAQETLSTQADKGRACPCCNQYVRIYRRNLYGSIVRWLVWLHKTHAVTGTWVDVKRRQARGGDYAKLAYWNLAERKPKEPSDEQSLTRTSGLWRPTPMGILFVRGEVLVPRNVHVYNSRVLGFSGPVITCAKALGSDFDYASI